MTRSRIGIVGFGMVGSAVGAWFKRAKIFDLQKFPDGLPAVNDCDIVFICVPTPYHRRTGYDLQPLQSTAKKLTGRKIVIVKSTVLPGTTAHLQQKFPQHTWLFNPEFLRDKSAVQDFLKPDRQIVGAARRTKRSLTAARRVMRLLPPAPYTAITSATEAEMIKGMANAFLATKVVFANMLYELAQHFGADYETVKLGIGRDPRIGTGMMNVIQDGYRGYSGKCFPKDVGALIWWGKKHRHRLRLLEAADAINWQLLPPRHRRR